MPNRWTIEEAKTLYNLAGWSDDYFDIDDQGHVIIKIPEKNHPGIDLYQLVQHLSDTGLRLPILVRFQDILINRVNKLFSAFNQACQTFHYQGQYTAVYPIKVNQQRSVVESIISQPKVGLEAGSKPELMAVIALSNINKGIIICNGYKDQEYIKLALIAKRLGHQTYIVIEKPSEVNAILKAYQTLNITPLLGIRVRLASIGSGKWQNTGGEKGKFGLSAAQTLEVIEKLRHVGLIDNLQLLHFHMGSQLANIRDIQKGLTEAAHYYHEFYKLDVPLKYIDVGGGLGIDYEGSRSRNYCSMNYQLQEYANNVVRIFSEICTREKLPHPHIITEAGRAMTAHHAVLITNVTDVETPPIISQPMPPDHDTPNILQDLWDLYLNEKSLPWEEIYHEISYWLTEAHNMYNYGLLSLKQRAQIEALYYSICYKIQAALQESKRPDIKMLEELNEKLSDKYFCNFSLFQSVPDIWGIDQIFPIMPLHRLDKKPEKQGIIVDLTCDSDGQIHTYVNNQSISSTLPLHQWYPDQQYLIGIFLVGAYQEILGDLHNLFGDTDSININLTENATYQLSDPEKGDSISELLSYVHFNPQALLQAYQEKLQLTQLTPEEYQIFSDLLENGLNGYTYLEDE